MRRLSGSDILLKALGLLLLVAAVLKSPELLTIPVANKALWSWRPFLIFQMEFELVLGIWLLAGVFKRLARLAISVGKESPIIEYCNTRHYAKGGDAMGPYWFGGTLVISS